MPFNSSMLLAAIVQITLWIIGVIGHNQGMPYYFKDNTVKDKKVFPILISAN